MSLGDSRELASVSHDESERSERVEVGTEVSDPIPDDPHIGALSPERNVVERAVVDHARGPGARARVAASSASSWGGRPS